MADTAALVVALSAQVTKFEKDMKDAVGIADKRTKQIEDRFSKMNDTIADKLQGLANVGAGQLPLGNFLTKIGPVGVAVAAGIGAATIAFDALSKAVANYVEQASHLRDASDTTGLTIVQLDELAKIGLDVGVSAEQVEQSIGKMTVAIDGLKEAQGPLFDKLKQFPQVLSDINNARDAAGAIDVLVKHFASLGSEFEKNAFLRAAFGRGGLPFGRVLTTLGEKSGLKQVEADAIAAGKALDPDMIKKVDDMADQLKLIKKQTDDLWGEAFGELILSAQIRAAQNLEKMAQAAKDLMDGFNNPEAKSAIVQLIELAKSKLPAIPTAPTTNIPAASGLQRGQPVQQVVQPEFTRTTQPDVLAPLTGEQTTKKMEEQTAKQNLTIEQRIKALKDYIAVMGDLTSATKKRELVEAEVDKAVRDKTITPEDANRKKTIETIDLMIETLQKEITAKGASADADDRAQLEELKLQRAKAAGVLSSQQYVTALSVEKTQKDIAALAAKEAAQTATEEEIARKNLLQIQLQLQQQGQKNIDITVAETIEHKKAKEAIEARAVAASNLPQAMRYAQDSMNGWKQADQALVSFAGNFENAMADLITGSKSAAEVFKSLTDSIIRDLIRMSVRMAITGPLFNALTGSLGGGAGLGSAFFGGGSPSGYGRAIGGPVSANQPYVVGEKGPELFVPTSAGHIVPNSVSGGTAQGGLKVTVNNYASGDTDTTQQQQQGPNGAELIIGIVKKEMSKGGFDDVNRGRYGLRAVKAR